VLRHIAILQSKARRSKQYSTPWMCLPSFNLIHKTGPFHRYRPTRVLCTRPRIREMKVHSQQIVVSTSQNHPSLDVDEEQQTKYKLPLIIQIFCGASTTLKLSALAVEKNHFRRRSSNRRATICGICLNSKTARTESWRVKSSSLLRYVGLLRCGGHFRN